MLALLAAGWPVVVLAQPGTTVRVSLDARQIGGARTTLHELFREILGVGRRESTSETLLTLTATVLD